LSTPAYALMRSVPDVICHRIALSTDVEPAQIAAFLDELNDELWSQSKELERERAMVSLKTRTGDRTFPSRAVLLERRARHLAADISMVDQMRAVYGASRKKRTPSHGLSSQVGEARPPRVSRVRPRGGGEGG